VWDGVSGEGIVCHGSVCHHKAIEDNEILTEVDPIDNLHPKYNECIEKGSFTAMPGDKLH